MTIKHTLWLLLVVSMVACDRKDDHDNGVYGKNFTTLLNKSKDNSLHLSERLAFSLKADSIAIEHANLKEQIESKKIVAILYLETANSRAAKHYFIEIIELGKKLSDQENQAIALNNLGTIYNEVSEYDSAFTCYQNASELYSKIGDQLGVGQSMVNIGIIYKNQGNFDSAFKVTFDAVKILESLNSEEDLSYAYTTLGNILKELNRLDDALQYHQFALKIRTNLSDSAGIAWTLNNIGNIYRIRKAYDSALFEYQKSLKMKESLGLTTSMCITLDNIALTYFESGNSDSARMYFIKAMSSSKESQNIDEFLTASHRLTKLLLKQGEVKDAETLSLQTKNLLPRTGFLKHRLDNSLALAEVKGRLAQYDSAVYYSNRALELKDSLFDFNIVETVSKQNALLKLSLYQKELSIQSYQLQTKQNYIFLLVTFLFLLCILIYLLLRSNKKVNRSNKEIKIVVTQLEDANRSIETMMDELHHRVKNNLQIITDILTAQIDIVNDAKQGLLLQATLSRLESIITIHNLFSENGFSKIIDMKQFIEMLFSNLMAAYETKQNKFDTVLAIQDVQLNIDRAIPVGLIINELITNVFKHAKSAGGKNLLEMKLNTENGQAVLSIMNSSEYFNFEDTSKSKGLGFHLVKTLVKQIEGSWKTINNKNSFMHIIEFKVI